MSELVTIDKKVEQEKSIIITKASELTVTDKESCDVALGMGKTINALKKEINGFFDPMVKAAHQSHKAVKTRQNEAIEPLDEAKGILSTKITTYNQELQRKQQEEADRLRKIAEKEADEARKALEAKAEEAAANDNEEEFYRAKMLAESVTVEDHAPVARPAEKVKGAQKNWQIKSIDLPVLLKAVLDGKAPMACIIADEKYIGKRAKMEGKELNIPGVVVHDTGTVKFG